MSRLTYRFSITPLELTFTIAASSPTAAIAEAQRMVDKITADGWEVTLRNDADGPRTALLYLLPGETMTTAHITDVVDLEDHT